MTGLPVDVLRSVVGHALHSARSGHVSGRGEFLRSAHAVAPSGIPHHATPAIGKGTSANGTNSHSATGGYSTSPARMSYGPASWYGSKYGPPASQRAATSRYSAKSTPSGCSSGSGISATNAIGTTKTA